MALIKPCPFCGSDETVYVCKDEEDMFQVVCDFTLGGCGASSAYANSTKEAIQKWNRRADKKENEKYGRG